MTTTTKTFVLVEFFNNGVQYAITTPDKVDWYKGNTAFKWAREFAVEFAPEWAYSDYAPGLFGGGGQDEQYLAVKVVGIESDLPANWQVVAKDLAADYVKGIQGRDAVDFLGFVPEIAA